VESTPTSGPRLATHPLDSIISQSLFSFAAMLRATGWYGREREAVSLYAMGYLVPYCRPGTVLYDPTQIGIEVAVPQLGGADMKAQVCKDLVVWPAPAMTCWDAGRQPTVPPLAVLEWKKGRSSVYGPNVDWLTQFTARWPTTVGYAITVDLRRRRFLLRCTRVMAGVADPVWVEVA
jgi:hypothetical protein